MSILLRNQLNCTQLNDEMGMPGVHKIVLLLGLLKIGQTDVLFAVTRTKRKHR